MEELYKHDASEKSQIQKRANPICTKCPDQANKQRQKVELWLPGSGGRGLEDCQLMGTGFPFGAIKKLWD